MIIRNKRSTTLFEIIVATVIFSLVIAGILGVFVAGKRHIMHAQGRMTSSEIGKLFIDPLQFSVRQDTWDNTSNGLSLGITSCSASGDQNPACPSVATQRIINNIDYTAQYNVSALPNTDLRKVAVRINWDEPSP